MTPHRTALPIDDLLPEVAAALRRDAALVVEAPPGAGKTTRLPPALLDVVAGEIVVLEPRRLAARLAARRVAEERGEPVGATVGYQVRFEEVAGPATRIRFVTEGLLARRLVGDPRLDGIGAVVLDEFHERHLQGDLALALLERLRRGARPDLRLVVMSATLDAEPVVRFLGGCPRLRAEGRRFEVAIEHLAQPDERPLGEQVASALRRLVADGLDGDVLVFLPGAGEIARARDACAEVAERHGLLVAALHGDLPAEEQDRAIRRADRPKVILSTNVAESSVTIEGVVAVIDSGLARVAGSSPWSGLPTLRVARVSRASAAQRAGRAGRTRPGRALRLYTRHDHDTRPAHDVPEILRADLAEAALALHGAGIADPAALAWLDPPPATALAAAEALLGRLGALDGRGGLTAVGARLLRFPLHPRLGRLLVEAEDRGVARDGSVLAALAGERPLEARTELAGGGGRERPGGGGAGGGAGGGRRGPAEATTSGPSDLLAALDLYREAERAGFAYARLRSLGVDPGAARAVERAARQLARLTRRAPGGAPGGRAVTPEPTEAEEQSLLVAVLAGFPDRVARRRRSGSTELLLAAGGSAELSPASVVRAAELVVVVVAEERRTGTSARTVARAVSAIEPEWLLDLFPDAMRDETELAWNPAAARVEAIARLRYDELVLEERRRPPAPSEAERAAELLAAAALAGGAAAGARRLVDGEALDRWLGRVAFCARTFPEEGLVVPGDDALAAAVARACRGRAALAELADAPILAELRSALAPRHLRLVEEMAPERVRVGPGTRAVRVTYEPDKPPWIASRLQDFFGVARTPSVAGGRVPLVVHLLAPNGRAVQVTTDLAGFWTRHYPAIRRELMRRYPKHAWPETPGSGR